MKRLDPEGAAVDMRQRVEAIAARAQPRGLQTAVAVALDDLDDDIADHLAERSCASWTARIPSRFVHARIDDFDGDTAHELAAWADKPGSRNLVLFGPVGTGKSHAAVAACRPSHDAGFEVKFVPTGRLLNALRPGGPEGAMDSLANVERLIWDDIGREYRSGTGWAEDQIYDLVNMRWLYEMPTVFTSNLDPDALRGVLGEAVFDRVVGSDAVVIRLTGKSRRRRGA